MAQPYVPGPCQIWVQGTGGPVFLGYSERGVSIDIHPRYSQYVMDMGGSEAMDWYYDGSAASVSATLTWWNESIYSAIANYPGANLGVGFRGIELLGAIGTMMAFENAAYLLYLVFTYGAQAAKPAYVAGGMPAGYRFLRAMLDRDSLPERGSRPAKLHLTWRCFRDINRGPAGAGTFILYDNNVGLLAGVPVPM